MAFPSEQEHYDAVKAALVAANAVPYDYGVTIPSGTPAYTLLTITDRFGGVQRLSSQIGTRSVRVTVVAIGKTAANVREMRRRADVALRENRLTVADFVSTPIQFETADAVGPDGDELVAPWYSARVDYTYTV